MTFHRGFSVVRHASRTFRRCASSCISPAANGRRLIAGIDADGVSNRMHSLSPPLRTASKNGRKQKTPDMHREFGGDPGRT